MQLFANALKIYASMYDILMGKIICFFLNDLRFYSWVKNIFKLAKITVNTNTQLKIPMSES